MENIKTVNDLLPGEKGIIKEINSGKLIKQRLMDMGIIHGATVEMVRPAPLGDPIQIRVFNSLLALRRDEAELLIVDHYGEKPHGPGRQHRHRACRKS